MVTIKKLYMAVTPDEYELPLFVTDNVAEMAAVFHTKPNTILSSIAHGRSGSINGRKFVRVEINE